MNLERAAGNRKSFRWLCGACAAASCLLLGSVRPANASVQVDLSSYSSGIRQTVGTTGTGNGLYWFTDSGEWSGGAFSIAWQITQSSSNYTYKYTITTPANARLSHWILELSPVDAAGASLESYWEDVFVKKTEGGYVDTGISDVPEDEVGLTGSHDGNPGMLDIDDGNISTPADKDDIFGVRFTRDGTNSLNVTDVTFTTPQVPVWGDFYARDGKSPVVHSYNLGFGTDPAATATDFTNWIPRPDGFPGTSNPPPPEAPEPASFAVWSLLAAVVAFVSRRSNS